MKPFSRRKFLGSTMASLLASGFSSRSAAKDVHGALDEVVSVRIYPAIGVARVGNSDDDDGFFIGPEVLEPGLVKAGEMRDLYGAIKRQAARFRIYGYNSAGVAICELTSQNSQITWTAHLANKKAQWYRFVAALDIPSSSKLACAKRNASVVDRKALLIDAGLKSIAGPEHKPVALDGGRFQGVAVSLGELRTDENGRLLVLGGKGRAGSPQNKPVYDPDDADSFNNADGWFDDIADGPVTATVKIGKRTLEAMPAWVTVAPPNYAPNVIGWRTMYDLLLDANVAAGWLTPPTETSFVDDILPMLSRLGGLQWVNKGFADRFGRGGKIDFTDPELLGKLSNPSASSELRAQIFKSFRLPRGESPEIDGFAFGTKPYLQLWPMLYGDSYGGSDDNLADDSFIVSGLRLAHLKRWVAGNFKNDFSLKKLDQRKISSLPIADQPEMLNRAALHYCLADAFHPGCELTWPMRHVSLFKKPVKPDLALLFRIKTQTYGGATVDNFGEKLTPARALDPSGPLQAQGPGDLTKWMALPWHGDTAFCRSGYDKKFDPYIQSFWPARVPNHVLAKEDYDIVMDPKKSRAERLDAFHNRQHWVRHLPSTDAPAQMIYMTGRFSELGVVEARTGPNDPSLPEIPHIVFVESLPPMKAKSIPAPGGVGAPTPDSAPRSASPSNPDSVEYWQETEDRLLARYKKRADAVRKIFSELRQNPISAADLTKAGWTSLEQFVEFRLVKFGRRP